MKTNIEFEVEVIKEENGMFSCSIPAYEIFFNAKKEEDIEKKSKVLLKSYLDYLHESNINGKITF